MSDEAFGKWHGSSTAYTCTAQQLQQHSFYLVVGMVSERNEITRLFGECRMS